MGPSPRGVPGHIVSGLPAAKRQVQPIFRFSLTAPSANHYPDIALALPSGECYPAGSAPSGGLRYIHPNSKDRQAWLRRNSVPF